MHSIVTPVENIETDEHGQHLIDASGSLVLKNESDIGMMVKIHVTQVQKLENGMLLSGTSVLAEVYWNLRRSPAPALVAPTDIAWLTIGDEPTEEIEDETTDEEGELTFSDDEEFEEVYEEGVDH